MSNKFNFIPDDNEVQNRQKIWENFFAKHTAIAEANADDEGMEMDDLIACMEAEEPDYDESSEEDENDDYVEFNLENDEIIAKKNIELSNAEIKKEKKLALTPVEKIITNSKKLTTIFDPSFIEDCKKAYQCRVTELSQRNLPFWNYSRSYENYNENHIRTPQFAASSKNYTRLCENMQGGNVIMSDPRDDLKLYPSGSINGVPIQNGTISFTQPILPPELQQLLPNCSSQRFNLQVRELQYNFSFNGTQELSSFFQHNVINNSFYPGHFNVSSLPINNATLNFIPTSNSTVLSESNIAPTTEIPKSFPSRPPPSKTRRNLKRPLQLNLPPPSPKKDVPTDKIIKENNDAPPEKIQDQHQRSQSLINEKKLKKKNIKKCVPQVSPSSSEDEFDFLTQQHQKNVNKVVPKKGPKVKTKEVKKSNAKKVEKIKTDENKKIKSNKTEDVEKLDKLSNKIKMLTIDDISCGSSCSTVTSDDDAKFFQAERYNKLREKKKLSHRQHKLEKMLNDLNGVDKEELKPETSVVTKKIVPIAKKKDSSSSCESDDDFFLKAVQKAQMKNGNKF
ncbi:hypothetical protein PVAND_013011 [Polypedilum vanderplanki]|uniref:Uncharacterized protein n=1 Tax=Polypedilum vanderplanki TaxID=319348 RepID=A0A9J6CN69_POLVA|nr:hypothetical protein PVAND_013011 [Polypedilum vanderplanki]